MTQKLQASTINSLLGHASPTSYQVEIKKKKHENFNEITINHN